MSDNNSNKYIIFLKKDTIIVSILICLTIFAFLYSLFATDGKGHDYFVQEGEKTLPFGFYGFIFLLSSFYFISEKLIWFSNPLTGLIGIMAFYILVSMIFEKKTAIISSFLLAFSAPYLYYVNFFVADIPAFMFLILAMIYFLKIIKEPEKLCNYIIFPLFFSWSFLSRYPNILPSKIKK